MKYAIVIFIASALLGVAAGLIVHARADPGISVDRIFQDLGLVRYGDVVRTTFRIHNSSKFSLVITDVRTSCGCTKGFVEPRTILPGSEGILSVSFDPAVHKDDTDLGELERIIYVETDNPKIPELIFRIHANVYKQS